MNMKERYPDYRWRINYCGIFCNPQKGCEAKDKVRSYHSHTFEFVKYHGKTMYDLLIEETDPEGFHFIQDTFWMKYGGLNHHTYMEKVAGRMDVMHAKDFTVMTLPMGRIMGETGTIGEGNIDYPPILRTAEHTGVKVIAIEQDRCQRDPFDSLHDALRELKRLLAETEQGGKSRLRADCSGGIASAVQPGPPGIYPVGRRPVVL